MNVVSGPATGLPEHLVPIVRFLSGQVPKEEIAVLAAAVSFAKLDTHSIDEVTRIAAVRQIAEIVRVPVVIDCTVEHEYDDNGGTYPNYHPTIRPADDETCVLQLDSDPDYALSDIDTLDVGNALVKILGAERATVTASDDGSGVADVATTDDGTYALFLLYKAIVWLARHDESMDDPIHPAARSTA